MSFLNVIYNEEKAAENTKQFQKTRRSYKTMASVMTAVFFLCSAAVAASLYLPSDWSAWLFIPGLLIGGVACGLMVAHASGAFNDDPKPDVTYYLSKKNENVLGVRVETRPGPWQTYEAVCLVTENKDGAIDSTPLCRAKYQENTKVQENTFDVNKGVIYTPMVNEAAKNEE